jgi:flap endonuclease-1
MGIKGLGKFIRSKHPQALREVSLASFRGKQVAVDAPIFMYRFCAVNPDTFLAMFQRQIQTFQKHDIVPTYVFDGARTATQTCLKNGVQQDLKTETLQLRRKRKANWKEKAEDESLSVAERLSFQQKVNNVPTAEKYRELKQMLVEWEIPFLVAEGDAEKKCVELCKAGKAEVVFSEDFDVLPFGWNLCTGLGRKKMVEYDVKILCDSLRLTHEEFVDFCILSGCDYCCTIGNIGPVRALKLLQVHHSIENILQYIDRSKYKVHDHFPYTEARKEFQTFCSSSPNSSESTTTSCFFEFL